ncbi:hypothetical protein AVEN_131990-1 [Araneus ventricosus]|uniref:Uncharacterized protein n=1 Tax=Araneus ventricosus TaxID=182803 RepID=A0A4Y2B2I5_ARAVE|nr:hypothetical protein AVEN_131990-1 [Araneus ventricosus]
MTDSTSTLTGLVQSSYPYHEENHHPSRSRLTSSDFLKCHKFTALSHPTYLLHSHIHGGRYELLTRTPCICITKRRGSQEGYIPTSTSPLRFSG